ncbi:hypothetical protein Q5M85_02360 [Paraclostridium bifermentans]|nr:hypothetical protein [Paraclostridium bifermentans]
MFELDYSSKTLILKMDSEVLEGQIEGFNDCIEGGDFIPPEICDANYKDTEISIYGIFKQKFNSLNNSINKLKDIAEFVNFQQYFLSLNIVLN